MRKISIVTDSTSDLPENLYTYNLTFVPLSVVLHGKVYIDNHSGISPENFYRLLKNSKEMPLASEPTPGDFIKIYGSLIEEDRDIISIHISAKLSGTLNSARLASNQFSKERVSIIDSGVVHMSCGFTALKSVQMAG